MVLLRAFRALALYPAGIGANNPQLQDALGGSRNGIVRFFDRHVDGGDVIFMFWAAINGKKETMKPYWVE